MRQLNGYLAQMRTDLYKLAEKFKEDDLHQTAISLRDAYLEKD